MKKLAIVLAVVSILALCQTSQATNLKAGWYVEINQISVWGDRWPNPPQFLGWGQFSTPAGQYGLLTVDSPSDGSRRITVNTDSNNVGPEQSLVLPTNLSAYGGSYNSINIDWATNCDPNAMALELWKTYSNGTNELLGTWSGLGPLRGESYANLGSEVGSSYYFKVAVVPVPEPSALSSLLAAFGCFAYIKRWRKH